MQTMRLLEAEVKNGRALGGQKRTIGKKNLSNFVDTGQELMPWNSDLTADFERRQRAAVNHFVDLRL